MNESERKYLDNSIIKPYLIHVEFELENILTKIQKDNKLRSIYSKRGYNVSSLEISLHIAIDTIKKLESIFKHTIN